MSGAVVRLVLAAVLELATGCKSSRPASADAGVARAEVHAASSVAPANARDAGPISVPTAEHLSDAELGTLAHFSASESHFAYANYSEPADLTIVTVLEVATNAISSRFPLDGPKAKETARDALHRGDFRPAVPVSGKEAHVVVSGGTLRVELPGQQNALYSGNPFGADGTIPVGQAKLQWKSHSGRVLAVETLSVPHGEFGTARTYALVALP